MMSRFIIQNKIENPVDLKALNAEGYRFDKKSSTENDLVFLRDAQWKIVWTRYFETS